MNWLMKNSSVLKEYLQKADNAGADSGFGFFAIAGIVQYALLIAGWGILVILTAYLIRNKSKSIKH